jgi:hypothetical protein
MNFGINSAHGFSAVSVAFLAAALNGNRELDTLIFNKSKFIKLTGFSTE